MISHGATRRSRKWSITILVVATFAFEGAFAPRAEASLVCANLFAREKAPLPEQLEILFQQLKPKVRLKFEARFQRREEISAEREASRIIARLLLDNESANLKLKPILKRDTRAQTIRSLLNERLDVESTRISLENTLIEIGYSEGSPKAQMWRAFRERHTTELSLVKKVAINFATTLLVGVPLHLAKVKTAGFKVPKAERAAWPDVEAKLRARIGLNDPVLLKKVKYEVAFEFVRRMVALAVLAILTDEFLTYVTPEWGLLKMKIRGTLVIESRERLEAQALENWKDIAEAFLGRRPADDDLETLEVRARIQASSRNELWLHLHEGGALSDPLNPPTPTSAAPRTN